MGGASGVAKKEWFKAKKEGILFFSSARWFMG
jgi:hypothetical protein